jgi:predicted RNase H-like nuclease
MRIAGADGCRAGWIVAVSRTDLTAMAVSVVATFADVVQLADLIAVDMPIGLPERIGPDGRGPEKAVRPLLGDRQSSVFSVPARSAIYARDYGEACRLAFETSDPPRKVSKQLFHIAPKIREVDQVLRADKGVAARVFEAHPEVAFWRMNGEQALTEPKKLKGTPFPPGLALRRGLLIGADLPAPFVEAAPPRGAAADDLLDALANLTVAARLAAGTGRPFPPAFRHDAHGLPMAIWT